MKSIVQAPGLRRHAHSLLDVANVVAGGRWEDGVAFTPIGCDTIFAHDAGCWIPRGAKGINQCHGPYEFRPYVLEITLAWSTLDLGADPKQIVLDEIQAGASAVMERLMELGPGDIASQGGVIDVPQSIVATVFGNPIVGWRSNPAFYQPQLEDGANLVYDGTNFLDCLGVVEAKMLDASDHIGGAGVLYMNPRVALATAMGLDWKDDGSVVTKATGSSVVIGNFANSRVYGHVGGVDVYLSEPDIIETVEQGPNEYIIQAECFAMTVWNDCTTVYSELDLPAGVPV